MQPGILRALHLHFMLSRPADNIRCKGCGRRAVEFSNEKMMRALKATAASITLLCASCVDVDVSRRRALQLHAFSAPVAVPPLIPVAPAHAAAKKYSAADAQKAFAELKAARAALDAVDKPLAGGDLEKAAAALQAPPLVAFEDNATIIVQAPVLTAEDKKAIGTIRRYGVAADVIIMVGGLGEALDNGDVRQAKSFLAKAKGSLDEVIGVARGGGLR